MRILLALHAVSVCAATMIGGCYDQQLPSRQFEPAKIEWYSVIPAFACDSPTVIGYHLYRNLTDPEHREWVVDRVSDSMLPSQREAMMKADSLNREAIWRR